MAQQHHLFTAAGARLIGISVDSVGQNAAMVDKLGLPFPLLSDPGGEQAIKAYDCWNAEPQIAHPAVEIVAPTGTVAFRQVGSDFADRPTEDEVLIEVQRLNLPATTQEAPHPGAAQPGERAFDLSLLPAYLRGAKFAATALSMRVPEAVEQAEVLKAEYERYLTALQAHPRGAGNAGPERAT